MARGVAILTCTKIKKEGARNALELYAGSGRSVAGKILKGVDVDPSMVYFLSAKYGLIRGDEKAEYYDVYIKKLDRGMIEWLKAKVRDRSVEIGEVDCALVVFSKAYGELVEAVAARAERCFVVGPFCPSWCRKCEHYPFSSVVEMVKEGRRAVRRWLECVGGGEG